MKYTKQDWQVGAALIGMLLCTMIGTRAWSQAQVGVTAEPYTKTQVKNYSETPDSVSLTARGATIFSNAEGVFSFEIVMLKGGVQIAFVWNGELVNSVGMSCTEKELVDTMKAMGAAADFTDALAKIAVSRLPK